MLNPKNLYNVESLSKSLGLKENTIREKARKGILPAYKLFGKFYFDGEDVVESIKEKGEKYGKGNSK